MHRGATTNDIIPKLTCLYYLTVIDASSGYHNLKLDEKSPYVTISACQFGTYIYARLPCGAALAVL